MKRIILSFCIILALLASCTAPAAQPEEEQDEIVEDISNDLVFSKENYPVIDGSTANIPLAVMMAQHFLDMNEGAATGFVSFNTTDIAYMNLAEKKCDLVLAYEISNETMTQLGDRTMFDYYEIGIDALVFLMNRDNPVDSLTQRQIVSIYSGDTTNWREVGGHDFEIFAFQRSKQSGSQTMMEKLVMQDTPMMERPEREIETMMGLISIVEDYADLYNAIGYSVYYYVENMYKPEGIKLLKARGVEPSNATIASGEYPFINPFYAVVRSDEPQDSPARQLAEWLTTEDGKVLIRDAGYVPTK